MVNESYDFLRICDNFKKTANVKSVCVKERSTHNAASITVTIPTYKDIEGLKKALISVLHQEDYDDYNIQIVNNSHLDTEIIDELIKQPGGDRISYYENEENIGMCANWNRCFELSSAKWTVMLHDDDTLSSNYLKEIMKIVQIRPNAGMVSPARYGLQYKKVEKANYPFERFCLLDIFPGNQLGAPTGVLFRTEYVLTLGGWNEENTQLFDYWFNALFLVHYPVYVTPLKLVHYRWDMSRYSDEIKINLLVSEYWLYMKVLRYAHIPSKIAHIHSHAVIQGGTYDLSTFLPIKNDYKSWQFTFARRYIKIYSTLNHIIKNLIDKIIH